MADSLHVLELNNVTKRFGALEILKGVNLTVPAGETLAILGPSGAGKSTLLHVAGLMEGPTSGSVRVGGQAAENLSEPEKALKRLDSIGFLFQFHYLLPDLNVLENVLVPPRLAGDDLSRMKPEAESYLERLGLKDRFHHKPHQLSGGEQQRTALARALIRKPHLLLCDEPTGNLDPHTAGGVADLLLEEAKRAGTALIVVTHNETLAQRMARSYYLRDGLLQ